MGNSSSVEAEDDEALLDPFDGADTLGYRVLGVQPNSPASKAGLVSFLDFLVGANGEMLLASGENVEHGEEYPDVDLPALLEEHKGKNVEFLVWNMKSQEVRLVNLVPDDSWGGAGLLGVTIRLDNYAGAEDRLVRVLEVEPQSPAAMAGLVPFNDYILGTTSETLQDASQLGAILEDNVDCVVELYVYNSQSDLVRTVALMPTLSWGGRGLLGAAVGTGYLHRFPSKTLDTTGKSVERKVRYVGSSPSPAAVRSGKAGDAAKMSKPAGGTTVELEPQLEMEAPDDDEESHEEANAAHPTSSSKPPATPQPVPTVQQTANPQQEATKLEAQSTQKPASDEMAHKQSHTSSVAATPTKTGNTGVNAAAIFAGPPPDVVQ